MHSCRHLRNTRKLLRAFKIDLLAELGAGEFEADQKISIMVISQENFILRRA